MFTSEKIGGKIRFEVVKHFCNLPQDKNPSDAMIVDNGATPLHHAAYEGQIDIVKHLVKFLDNRNLSKKVKQKK